jgi:predicted phage terminase large subunit-like protein
VIPIHLDADTIHGFVDNFLIDRFDEKVPIGRHHIQWWRLVTDPHPWVAIAGPRRHAKSTALNHAYGLAASLFRAHPFQLKICKTYELAVEKVMQAKDEILGNEKLMAFFHPKRLIRDRENDIIVEMDDGYQWRIAAMGMDQAKRGWSWGTTRPTLIQVDDGEDDIEVLNPETRNKTMKTLLKVILPMGADRCMIRVYGTVLHQDSMLARLLRNKQWKSIRQEACNENVDPHSILWPEKYSVKTLKDIKEVYLQEGDLASFNMEWRNIAVDAETSFFRPSDFKPMEDYEHSTMKVFYVGGDLAISKERHRDYTVFYVGGLDENGILHIVDERRGRWDGKQIIDEMYSIEEAWQPEEWFIESGAIKTALGAALEIRMAEEGYLNLAPDLIPTKDKAIRAMPIQARMRARGVKWDTEASWFQDAKQELLEFAQEGTRGSHDDRVDALAWLGHGLKRMKVAPTEQEAEQAAYEEAKRMNVPVEFMGRSSVTGY